MQLLTKKGEHKPSHPIQLLRFQQAVRQQSRRLPCMRARQPDAFPSDFISAAKLWQYDHVSGSYLSMLNSSFETEQERHTTSIPKSLQNFSNALAKAMRAVFTEEQLATCSFKGGITTNGDRRVGLPEAEREAVIDKTNVLGFVTITRRVF
ncbi:hypothetical protein DPMN_166710 [Dreissena polymorpha]|uniref:Uncharacterized protein n=1 Tax=Dreissena polymorpha TaxID=45954 RepID=A0A9D4F2L3_DREPO|nr:hypothetical protein DPMN_166710 [Dreissena polymorpha]